MTIFIFFILGVNSLFKTLTKVIESILILWVLTMFWENIFTLRERTKILFFWLEWRLFFSLKPFSLSDSQQSCHCHHHCSTTSSKLYQPIISTHQHNHVSKNCLLLKYKLFYKLPQQLKWWKIQQLLH